MRSAQTISMIGCGLTLHAPRNGSSIIGVTCIGCNGRLGDSRCVSTLRYELQIGIWIARADYGNTSPENRSSGGTSSIRRLQVSSHGGGSDGSEMVRFLAAASLCFQHNLYIQRLSFCVTLLLGIYRINIILLIIFHESALHYSLIQMPGDSSAVLLQIDLGCRVTTASPLPMIHRQFRSTHEFPLPLETMVIKSQQTYSISKDNLLHTAWRPRRGA